MNEDTEKDGTEDGFSEVVERLNQVESRVDALEKENEELREENEFLKDVVAKVEDENASLRETVKSLVKDIEELQTEKELLQNQMDGVNNSIESVENKMSEFSEQSERNHADIAYRVSQIENALDLDVVDISVSGDGDTVIEQFASLPTEVKEEHLTDSMRRATVIYENFTDWGEFTKKGYVLTSGDLKKFLSASYETEFEWSQIYRVMKSFEEGTPPEFEYTNTERQGKVLVRYHDATEARAEATTQNVKNKM